MTSTENYKIAIQDGEEHYSVGVLNENFQKIDSAIYAVQTAADGAQTAEEEARTSDVAMLKAADDDNLAEAKDYTDTRHSELNAIINTAQAAAETAQQTADAAYSAANNAQTSIDTHKSEIVLDHPDGSVTTEKIADKGITIEKLANSARSSYDGTTGVLTAPILRELTVSSGLPYNRDIASINNHPLRDDTARAAAAKATKFYVSDSAPTYTTAGNIGDIAAVKTDSETDPYDPIYMCLGRVSKIVLEDGRILGGTGLYKWINISDLFEIKSVADYSTAPKKVGTWIDGTPVWRVCVDDTISSDASYYDVTCVKDINAAKIINQHMMLYHDGDMVGDRIEVTIGPGGGAGEESSWYYTRPDIGAYTNIYGFIEFVTPKSNLK